MPTPENFEEAKIALANDNLDDAVSLLFSEPEQDKAFNATHHRDLKAWAKAERAAHQPLRAECLDRLASKLKDEDVWYKRDR